MLSQHVRSLNLDRLAPPFRDFGNSTSDPWNIELVYAALVGLPSRVS
jgi:hypothetical protein